MGKKRINDFPTVDWYGTGQADYFVVSGQADIVYGRGGDDYIADSEDSPYNYQDQYYGNGGDDTLMTLFGNDKLFGGDERDTLIANTNRWKVHLDGGDGWDRANITVTEDFSMIVDEKGRDVIVTESGGMIILEGIEKINFNVDTLL